MIDKKARYSLVHNLSVNVENELRKQAALSAATKYLLGFGGGAAGLGAAGYGGYRLGAKRGTTTGRRQMAAQLLPHYIRAAQSANVWRAKALEKTKK